MYSNCIKRPSRLSSEFKQKYIQAACFSLRGNRQPSLPRLGPNIPGRTPMSGIPMWYTYNHHRPSQ